MPFVTAINVRILRIDGFSNFMIGLNFITMQGQTFYNIEASPGLLLCALRKMFFFLNELISVL